jgi:hypothetical protein
MGENGRFLKKIADFSQGYLILSMKARQPVQKITVPGKIPDIGDY